jgi:hypothetical protein
MAGLLDSLFATPGDQAMWATGAGLLGVRRGEEGNALMQGLKTYNLAQESQRRNKHQELLEQQMRMQLEEQRQQQADAAAKRAFFGNQSNLMNPAVPAVQGNEMDGGEPGAPASPKELGQIAQALIQSGQPALVAQGFQMMQKDNTPHTLADGAILVQGGKVVAENKKDPRIANASDANKKMQELVAMGIPPEVAQKLAYGMVDISPNAEGATITDKLQYLMGQQPRPQAPAAPQAQRAPFPSNGYDPNPGDVHPSQFRPGEVLTPPPGARATPPKVPGITDTGAAARADKRSFEQVNVLRDDFNKRPEVVTYKQAKPVFDAAKNAPDTPQGDLQLIYAVGKVLDPNSVVREGEMSLVIKSGSPMERLVGTTRYVANGKGKLTPQARQRLLDALEPRVKEYEAAYNRTVTGVSQMARQRGLDPSEIIVGGDPPTTRSRADILKQYGI